MDAATRQRYMQMPMPAHWEVKYDFSSRRYFFIDHNTKKTTWEDPRPEHYARLERQKQQQQHHQQQVHRQHFQPQQLSSSQAATSLGSRGSPSTSAASAAANARRPETILLQQMSESPRSRQASTRASRQPASSDADALLPSLEHDFELAVLQSKFPNKTKDVLQAALVVSNGNVNAATMRLRQGFDGEATSEREEDRNLGGKCRSLNSDFPEMTSETVMNVLKEHDGSMYHARERLKKMRAEKTQQDSPSVSLAAKVRALGAKFSTIEETIIREMLEESNGDTGEVTRKLLIITNDSSAQVSPASAQRHHSPQPKSVMEGTNSLERQQKHRLLVSALAAEFPSVERATVRRTLASNAWKIDESRQKLKDLTVGGLRNAVSPGPSSSRANPSSRPTTAQSSASSSSAHSLPSAPQAVQKPTPQIPAKAGAEARRKHRPKSGKKVKKVKAAARTKPKVKNAPDGQGARRTHESLAQGPNTELLQGPSGLAQGPNVSLRCGPQASLVVGPSKATCGRNIGLALGPDPLLPKGSTIMRTYETVTVL